MALISAIAVINVVIVACTGSVAELKPELFFASPITLFNRPGFLWALVAGGVVLAVEYFRRPRPWLRYAVALWNLAGVIGLIYGLRWSEPLMALWVVALAATAMALVVVPILKGRRDFRSLSRSVVG